MIAKHADLCYLATLLAVTQVSSAEYIAGIVVIALARTPDFWRWATCIREIAFRGLEIRRR